MFDLRQLRKQFHRGNGLRLAKMAFEQEEAGADAGSSGAVERGGGDETAATVQTVSRGEGTTGDFVKKQKNGKGPTG